MSAVVPFDIAKAEEEARNAVKVSKEDLQRIEPILPGSQMWEYFGTLLFHLMLPQAFTLQTAHPMVDTAVSVDKKYKYNPYGRAKDSTRLLWPIVYSRPEKAVEMGMNLKELHRKIKGVTADGKKYHALDPEAYSWVHVTGFDTTVRMHDYFLKPLTKEQRAQAFKEWQQMGHLLGVAEKYIFETEEEYWKHFNYIIDERLEKGPVLTELMDPDFMTQYPKHPSIEWMPDFLWKALMKVAGKIQYAIVSETLPEKAKAKFGIHQSAFDHFIFKSIQTIVRVTFPITPKSMRYIPLAKKAWEDYEKHPEAYRWESAK